MTTIDTTAPVAETTTHCDDCGTKTEHRLWAICLEMECTRCGRITPISETYVHEMLGE